MKRLKLLIFTLLMACQMQAQNTADYVKIDKETYDALIKKDWKKVTTIGQAALTEGVDYYYLRYRIGVAFYEMKQYRAAIPHFEKALIFNDFDEVSKEYLYYSYLFSEQYYDAERVSKTFRKATKKKLNIQPPPFLTTATAELGTKLPTFDSLRAMTFTSIGIGHRIADVATAFHNFSTVNQTVYYGKVAQKQYYLGVTVPLKNGFSIQPVFHLIDLNLTSTSQYVSSFHRTDFLGAVQVSKHFTFFDASVNASQSNLYNKSQTQVGAGVTVYPQLNNQLALSANATWQKDSTVSTVLFQLAARYRPTAQWELSAHFYSGNALNVNEINGFLVNNSYDVLKNRLGAMARFYATKNLSVYALGQFENRTESYYQVNYQNMALGVGLQWLFL